MCSNCDKTDHKRKDYTNNTHCPVCNQDVLKPVIIITGMPITPSRILNPKIREVRGTSCVSAHELVAKFNMSAGTSLHIAVRMAFLAAVISLSQGESLEGSFLIL
ncbi:hypothetical protein JTB14_001729 [Gonioctena quinquepunctata]|nr:hypothetical protein JTB14_001729 [Gonioctena quinquepunctata]